MGVDYGWEKFFSVLRYAISTDDSVQERLEGVMCGVCHLERDSFPDDELWARFQVLLKATTKDVALGAEGTIRATTSRMTNQEAAKWLQEALGIFSDLAEAYGAEFRSQELT